MPRGRRPTLTVCLTVSVLESTMLIVPSFSFDT
jgi:hypothetical protein